MNLSMIMPEMGENIDHGVVTRVEVAAGDQVEIGQPLIEVESDKVILEVPAEHSGLIKEISIKEGDEIRPGEQFAIIATQSSDSVTGPNQGEIVSSPAVEAIPSNSVAEAHQRHEKPHTKLSDSDHVYAGPSAHRLARELGISLAQVPGTAAQGRISVNDIKTFIRTQRHKAKTPRERTLPDFSTVSSISREPLSGIARTTARNMAHVWDKVPHAWLQIRADVTQLGTIRERQRSLNDGDHKLGLSVYLLKMLALTLKKFPSFNACYDEHTEELVLKKEIHLGLAVDSPRGLLVPVIRNADQLSLRQLADQLDKLVAAGRANQLEPEHLHGSGMTLSHLGGMGIDSLFPLLNWPEVAILGAGTITPEPVWHEERFVPCSMLTLVLGFDHRVINGADGARFLNHLKNLLENPFLAALQ